MSVTAIPIPNLNSCQIDKVLAKLQLTNPPTYSEDEKLKLFRCSKLFVKHFSKYEDQDIFVVFDNNQFINFQTSDGNTTEIFKNSEITDMQLHNAGGCAHINSIHQNDNDSALDSIKQPGHPLHRSLNEKGDCTFCDYVDVQKEAVTCFCCKTVFHALCKDVKGAIDPNNFCTKTFVLTHFIPRTENSSKRPGNFLFQCDFCVTCQEQDSVADTHNEILYSKGKISNPESDTQQKNVNVCDASLLKDVISDSISNLKSDILESVNKLIDSKFQNPPTNVDASSPTTQISNDNVHSYASATKSPNLVKDDTVTASVIPGIKYNPSASNPEVLVLRSDLTKEEIDYKSVQNTITEALFKIPVSFVNINRSEKKILIGFPYVSAREQGKNIISQCSTIKDNNFEISEPKKLCPKVTISNIPSEIFQNLQQSLSAIDYRIKAKNILREHILLKNDVIKHQVEDNHVFDIVYINVGERYATAGVKVSKSLREFLIQSKRIFILNSSCSVKDRFLYKQCFNCQKLNHMASDCPEKSRAVCMYCSGPHKAYKCSHKEDNAMHRCRNCSLSKNPQISSKCHTHHSGSTDCPIIKMAIERIRMNTDLITKN